VDAGLHTGFADNRWLWATLGFDHPRWESLLAEATESGGVVDPARMAAERRAAREYARVTGGGR